MCRYLSLVFSVCFLSFQSNAKVIEIDGEQYQCHLINQGGGAAACAKKAYSGPFTKSESTKLCQGAAGTGPADCAFKAYSGPFTKTQSIELCVGAVNTGPADCVTLAYAGPFTKEQSIEICTGAVSDQPAQCALDAYSGPFTKEESIDMCKAKVDHFQVMDAQGFQTEIRDKDLLYELIKKANLKAFKMGEYK